jgi:nucleolar complex protein 3
MYRVSQLSKEVAELREFEETLVKQYKLYIDFLSDSLKGVHKNLFKSSTRLEESLKMNLEEFAFICARCLCNLLERLSHFNHANELILLVVHHLTSKIHKCAAICIDTLKKLFSEDKELTLSLEITQKVTKMLKQKSFGVRPDILNIFLELKLKEIQLPDEAKKSKKMTHKEKKLKLSRNERKVKPDDTEHSFLFDIITIAFFEFLETKRKRTTRERFRREKSFRSIACQI